MRNHLTQHLTSHSCPNPSFLFIFPFMEVNPVSLTVVTWEQAYPTRTFRTWQTCPLTRPCTEDSCKECFSLPFLGHAYLSLTQASHSAPPHTFREPLLNLKSSQKHSPGLNWIMLVPTTWHWLYTTLMKSYTFFFNVNALFTQLHHELGRSLSKKL